MADRILSSNPSADLQSLSVGNSSSSLSSFEKFCGNSPFWDTHLLLDGSYPEFTACFRQVGVTWIPCLGYILASIPYLCYLLLKPCTPACRIGLVGIAKTICLVCLLIISMVTIIVRAQQKDTSNALYVSESLKAVVFILIMLVTSEERRKGIIASAVSWTFWFFLFSLNIIPFYSNFQEDKIDSDRFGFIIFLVYYAFVFLSLIIASFVENRANDYKDISLVDASLECPMLKSSIPSKLIFWWMTKLVLLAYKKPLDENDVFELRPEEKLAANQPKFERTWQKEKRKVDKYNNKIRAQQKRPKRPLRDQNVNEESPLVTNRKQSQSADTQGTKSPYKKVSVFKTLMSNHGLLLFTALIVKALADCFALTTPKITEALLDFVEHRERYPKWRGFALASSYLLVGALSSMVGNQAVFYTKVAAIRMKVALVNAIYRKSLTAASIGDETSKGEINNLMSVSAQRIQDLSLEINMLISAPAQVAIALYLLYNQLGVAVFAGLAIMFLTIPVNGMIAFMYEKWQMKMMTFKDHRNGLLSEIFNGIKVLKLYAWELSFQAKVRFIRNQELKLVLYIQYLMAIMSFFFQALPSLVQVTAFGVYIITSGYLDATVCFVSLQLFNMLNGPLMIMPLLIPTIIQTGVAFTRISNYLNKSDISGDSIKRDSTAENAVEIRNGSFTWTLDQPVPTLRNIDMVVQTGNLVAVVGTVGCGKSTLMSSILGETEKLSGDVTIQGTTAYVPQEAWIQNATLRDNILFGQDYRDGQYDRVIESCALKSDLDILPGSDMTEIGEKGINISGGQKQRVSLARAVYSDRDIYLLDDPLSAVDSHVGKHIFDKVIGEKGVLKNKTRILVTHGIHWLPMVDKIFVMTHGQISETGTYAELLEKDGAFARFIKEYAQETEKKEDEETEDEEEPTRGRRSRKVSVRSDGSIDLSDLMAIGESEKLDTIAGSKLTEEEFSMSGSVKSSTYLYFLKQVGVKSCIIGLTLYLMNAGCNIFSAIWLTKWTGNDYLHNRTNEHTDKYTHLTRMYLGVYAAGGVGGGLCVFVFFVIAAVRLTDASRKLHNNMLASVLRAPMLFFDTTPMGRILNRFTMDVEIVDQLLPMSLNQLLNVFCTVIVTIVNISYGTPIFLAALVPLVVIYVVVQTVYIPTCRQLRRIESVTRSPIYVHFSETLNGADSIRAYGCQERFIEESVKKVDHNVKFFFASSAAIGWLTVWLNFLGNMVMFLAAIFAVVATDIEPSVVGLSVAFASSMTMALGNMVNGMSDTETNAVSVERIKEYTHVESEAPWTLDDYQPKPEWPANGNITFDNYQTRYRPGLDLVLEDVSCRIKGGEKIGIVGRTGAGKSSMTVALFRIIEAAGGKIVIDGEDVSKMGLHDLRSKLTILPQDPVIFFGSLRMNLDPFDMYTDFDLWRALEHSYLKEFVEGLPGMLDYECGEEGSNLSVGQRQLVCLARTLLRKTKILVLDEATAAVDMETDDLIQKTIRKEFKDSTILTIAHRLNTIMDYDRVMVLDKGHIKEFDSPTALLADEDTIFHGMAKEAGLRALNRKMSVAP